MSLDHELLRGQRSSSILRCRAATKPELPSDIEALNQVGFLSVT
jgi:hypothetical protein